MNVVTYARVSTVKQETEGQSLVNQEHAFQRWLSREKATRIGQYAESKSAKSVEGRAQFLRMVAELPILKPDLVIVDTIDRFSRNLKDGLDLLERFRGHGIALLPLDWDAPVNLDEDRDWKSVVQELTAADYERRRIRNRIIKSYSARRARGATLHSHPPFGLLKRGDFLVPDPELVPILKYAARLFLRGRSQDDIIRYVRRKAGAKAWSSRGGLRTFLCSSEYSKVGIRSAKTQERIDEILAHNRAWAANRFRFDHVMTGIIACGLCVDLGVAPTHALLTGRGNKHRIPTHGDEAMALVCQRRNRRPHKRNVNVQELVVESVIVEILRSVSRAELSPQVEIRQSETLEESLERTLLKRLVETEKTQAYYREQIDDLLTGVVDIHDDKFADLKARVSSINQRAAGVSSYRKLILSEMGEGFVPRATSAEESRLRLARAMDAWVRTSNKSKNDLIKAFCQSVRSNPVLYRGRQRSPNEAIITWKEIAPDLAWRIRYGKCVPRVVEVLREPRATRALARLGGKRRG